MSSARAPTKKKMAGRRPQKPTKSPVTEKKTKALIEAGARSWGRTHVSMVVAGTVAVAYVGGVIGVHRVNVWRQRAAANGYPTLHWLDWDTLLAGLVPQTAERLSESPPKSPVEGGPTPQLLERAVPGESQRRHDLLSALVVGHRIDDGLFEAAGFSEAEARWLQALSMAREDPDRVLEKLEATPPSSAAEVYLREHLFLSRRLHAFNLELAVFSCKRRLNWALERFPETPALHFVRARASAMLGFTRAVVDDLARAVYFSRQSNFYLRAVLDMSWIEETRPALVQQCRLALDTKHA